MPIINNAPNGWFPILKESDRTPINSAKNEARTPRECTNEIRTSLRDQLSPSEKKKFELSADSVVSQSITGRLDSTGGEPSMAEAQPNAPALTHKPKAVPVQHELIGSLCREERRLRLDALVARRRALNEADDPNAVLPPAAANPPVARANMNNAYTSTAVFSENLALKPEADSSPGRNYSTLEERQKMVKAWILAGRPPRNQWAKKHDIGHPRFTRWTLKLDGRQLPEYRKWSEWNKIIDVQEKSNKPAKVFATDKGINPKTFQCAKNRYRTQSSAKRRTPDQNRQLVHLWRQEFEGTMTQKAFAERHGIHPNNFSAALKRYGG